MDNLVKLKIEALDNFGKGVARIDNKTYFVENALIDEEVLAKITGEAKNVVFASAIKLLSINKKLREEHICPYALECGGCDLMHLKYDYELVVKQKLVASTIKKIAGIEPIVRPTIKSDNIYHYRNKCIVPFQEIDGEVVYGFYAPRSHNVIKRTNCLIEPEIFSNILEDAKEYCIENEISIYDEKTNTGILRNIMLRINKNKEIMIVFILTKKDARFNYLALKLMNKYNITSVYLDINSKRTNVVLTDELSLIVGNPVLVEDILGLKFNVSPLTFLQVNHDQCEKLYSCALDYANLSGNEEVIDAYCGMGSITLNIAKRVKHVYGIEIVSKAIEDANKNKELNNISNATFICGKCEDEIKKLVKKTSIDVIFFDPPRKGCDQSFLDTVIEMKIPKIVYISCNIATCARDIKYLSAYGYELIEVTPVDLFSNSSHIESVSLLSLKK